MAAFSSAANAAMGGVDHLPDNLSVTDFWVDGAAGFQAGPGGANMPSPGLPEKWRPGLSVHVVWKVRDWQHDTSTTHEADVPVEPYGEDGGDVWVHFLANGAVRVVVSNMGPRAPNYPGPHDPIPRKNPWDMYPPRIDWRDMSEHRADIAIGNRRCANALNPDACADELWKKQIDEQLIDARRYLPPCAPMTGQTYTACIRQAERSMRAARFARRCNSVPDLPECSAIKTTHPSKNAEATGGTEQ